MPDQSGINWEEVEKNYGRRRRSATYASRQCPKCGRMISESAYSGSDGNWKQHARSCEKKKT
jgi:hypothetical protein